MKTIIVLLLVSLTVSVSDKTIIQSLLDGVFEQNNLKKPTTIVPCIDDVSARHIVVHVGELLDLLSKGSLKDILFSLSGLIHDFKRDINPSVNQCLNGNLELQAIGIKYNLQNETQNSIQQKYMRYIIVNYTTVHKWGVQLDDLWIAQNYYQVGYKWASYWHMILEISEPLSFLQRNNLYNSYNNIVNIFKQVKHLRNQLSI